MPFKEPFVFGPFTIDAEGGLSPLHHDVSPGFNVRWQGRVVHARLTRRSEGDGALTIQASLGRIPSTATDPATRLACFSTLSGVAAAMPAGWSVRMSPDHQPLLAAETEVVFPITAAALVTALTAFLIDLSPYLDVLDQAGIRPATRAAVPR